jgi:predicted permease
VAAARRSVVDVLRRGVTAAPRELLFRRVLVTAEVALAFSLLVCMTMLGTSLFRTLGVYPGFDAVGVLAMQVSLPSAAYPTPAAIASFYVALQDAVDKRLGAGTVAIVNEIPLTGDGGRRLTGAQATNPTIEAVIREASASYFDVMRIPIVGGRALDGRDDARAPRRALISESLAQRLFAGQVALGRQVFISASDAVEVVGVAGDVKHRSLDEQTIPTVYLSGAQSPSASSIVVVRSGRTDADVLTVTREEVARLDRDVPVYGTRSMRAVVAASPGVPTRRVLTAALVGFAVLAVVLGAIGLFGVVAHDVARRRSELALRLALGAEPRRIIRATLAQGSWMMVSGLAIGSVLSFWAVRVLGTVLFATVLDGTTMVGAAILLIAVGAAAIFPAALRAARTDPVTALRGE